MALAATQDTWLQADAALQSWLISLQARNHSPRTLLVYEEAVRSLLATLPAGVTVPEITRQSIEVWIAGQFARGLKPATVDTRFRGVRRFFSWLEEEGELQDSPMLRMKPPRVPESPVPVLESAQIVAMLKATEAKNFTARRDHAILRLFLATGMRLAELANLELTHIDLKERVAFVVGKGERPRVVPFDAKAAQALDRYLRVRPSHRQSHLRWLWLSPTGRLGSGGVGQMVSKLAKRLGFTCHPHQFRHTFAHAWLSAGGTEGDLMRLCGWRSRDMLNRYGASAATERAHEAYRRFNPAERF